MSNTLLETLLLSPKITSSENCDATYESLPVVIAEATKDLEEAFIEFAYPEFSPLDGSSSAADNNTNSTPINSKTNGDAK